jgi:holo-[acyl-carrier protein] synthase
MKAIGTGWRRGVSWRDFEVVRSSEGLEMHLSGRAAEFARARGSHRVWLAAALTRTHAIAQVLLEGAGGSSAT